MRAFDGSAFRAIADSQRAVREYWRQVDIGRALFERIDRMFTAKPQGEKPDDKAVE